jgi:hypothetical protein
MNSRHKKIMGLIFKNPVQANIMWTDIEGLLVALGSELSVRRFLENAGVYYDGV